MLMMRDDDDLRFVVTQSPDKSSQRKLQIKAYKKKIFVYTTKEA
jgi:hypothetical protein